MGTSCKGTLRVTKVQRLTRKNKTGKQDPFEEYKYSRGHQDTPKHKQVSRAHLFRALSTSEIPVHSVKPWPRQKYSPKAQTPAKRKTA